MNNEKHYVELINEDIDNRREEMMHVAIGSAEWKEINSILAGLYKIKLEVLKAETEIYEAEEKLKLEKEKADNEDGVKKAEHELNKKTKKHEFWINVAKVAISFGTLAASVILAIKGFDFEEEGTIASKTMNGVLGFFKLKSKD